MRCVLNTMFRAIYPPMMEIRYPIYRRLDGPQDWSGRVQKKNLAAVGFEPQTISLMTTRYAEHGILAVCKRSFRRLVLITVAMSCKPGISVPKIGL